MDRLLAAHFTAAGWNVHAVLADWERRGRQAGVLRDLALVARADALLAIWDGVSRRTRHLLQLAADRHLPVPARSCAMPAPGKHCPS